MALSQNPVLYLAINNEGQVVSNSPNGLFLYSGGTTVNLGSVIDLQWLDTCFLTSILTTPERSLDIAFGERSYLLTPTIPEPATLSLLAEVPLGCLHDVALGEGCPKML